MKKNIIKLSLLVVLAGFVSCEDATDIIQQSELSEQNAFRTIEDLQSGLNAVYGTLAPDAGGNGEGDAILFNDLFTDNIKRGIASSGQGNDVYNFTLQPSTGFANSLWVNRYGTINFANRILRAHDRIAPGFTGRDVAAANAIKAQLLALRAYCHFELLQYFTPDYKDPNSPSVIIMDFVPGITQVFPRNSAGEVFNFVNDDLEQAAELIGGFNSNISSAEHSFFVNPGMITALRARVALTQGNYELARTYAEEVMGDYAMASDSGDEYANFFLQDDLAGTEEDIFTLSRRQNDNSILQNYYANDATPSGSPFFEASNQLYDLYDPLFDVRKNIFFLPESPTGSPNDGTVFNGPDSPNNVIYIGKYQGSGDGTLINDVKLIRVTEMHMIKAEAEARAGNLPAAAATIRNIRTNRMTNTPPLPVYATTDEALRDILLERRKEFAFEGHRYLDLKRLGRELGIGISRNETDCASFGALQCGLPFTDHRWTLPIPLSEVRANPGIQQNPNY